MYLFVYLLVLYQSVLTGTDILLKLTSYSILHHLLSVDLSKSFQYFFNSFCPVENRGVTPHCLYCDSLTLRAFLAHKMDQIEIMFNISFYQFYKNIYSFLFYNSLKILGRNYYTAKATDVLFSVLAQSSKKVNNFSDSAAEAYLNYGCYKEFINILITLRRLHLGQ